MHKGLLTVVFSGIMALALPAQNVPAPAPATVPGELIVRFRQTPVVSEMTEYLGNTFSLGNCLVNDWHIYLVHFDPAALSQEQALNKINRYYQVETSQLNHELSLRNTSPNDPLLYKQWQYDKISAWKAWDITTGGVNRFGDTIVVAIIDDGVNPKYVDLKDNLWKNRNEIRWNGIDDDSDGYIDNYNGWNFYRNNDTLVEPLAYDVSSHGTSVAGIVGARGNNGTGITGVNWSIKMLPVIFVDGEADLHVYESRAVEAYTYVLKQRKLYNQTHGARGAYVVATNSSWGVNNEFASKTPLWCAMYDSLGKYGVMNCAATSNSDSNVDQVGDLPSTCPSQHLIMVTNTNINDQRSGSGYGATSVDLGAPGANVYTTIDDPALYGNQNGTSFASPQVAGAVGLLYASACEAFLKKVQQDPEQADLLVRQFILKGVDENASLTGITTTGGRLNLAKCLKQMSDWCFDPQNVKAVKVEGKVSAFPNPIATQSFDLISTVAAPCLVSVFDMSGKEVYSQSVDFSSYLQQPVHSMLPEGVYYVQCAFNSQQVYNTKLVVITN